MLRARQEIYPSHAGKAGVPGNAAVFYAPPRALASPQGDGTRLVTSRGRRTARRRAAESANVDPPFRYLLQNDRPSRGPALCVRCGDVNERVTHERVSSGCAFARCFPRRVRDRRAVGRDRDAALLPAVLPRG